MQFQFTLSQSYSRGRHSGRLQPLPELGFPAPFLEQAFTKSCCLPPSVKTHTEGVFCVTDNFHTCHSTIKNLQQSRLGTRPPAAQRGRCGVRPDWAVGKSLPALQQHWCYRRFYGQGSTRVTLALRATCLAYLLSSRQGERKSGSQIKVWFT